uniref:Uncharacterized protein n=1 Tax=Myotis lucifugus TaxID=59463 RepID=G1PZH2_MYOLU
FVNFSRLHKITDIQAEINQKNTEIELLRLEKDTADVHPSFLAQERRAWQSMNNPLAAVLKEKWSLRQRQSQENLPIGGVYHRDLVHLLEVGSNFSMRDLETHLDTIRNIPRLDANITTMSKALAKMDILVNETEEYEAENTFKWQEQQKEVSFIPKIFAGENYLHKQDAGVSPSLTFHNEVHVQTINGQ